MFRSVHLGNTGRKVEASQISAEIAGPADCKNQLDASMRVEFFHHGSTAARPLWTSRSLPVRLDGGLILEVIRIHPCLVSRAICELQPQKTRRIGHFANIDLNMCEVVLRRITAVDRVYPLCH